MKYELIFDEVIARQLKKIAKNIHIKKILSKMFDKIEELGPRAGKLLDPQLGIYEIKSKHPPIRLYYRHKKNTIEIYIFEYEMKTSHKKQQSTIKKIINKILKS